MKPIEHQLLREPYYYKPLWTVKHLFLGTFNPEGGKKVNYFYGRTEGEKGNKAWKILSEIFNTTFDPNDPLFFDQIKSYGIACMDLIKLVHINESNSMFVTGKGYQDNKIINNMVIREYNTMSILNVIAANPDSKIYSTWGTGPTLADWKKERNKIKNIINLVSPSMAARVPKGVHKYEYMLQDWKTKIVI
jgi:hypothetical protein